MTSLVQHAPLPPEHPDLAALHAHWQALRGERAMPARGDVDVIALRRWLGRLALLDVVDGGADFRFRVHGTLLSSRMGFDMTGRLLSEAASPLTASALAEYREVVRRRAPLLFVRSSVLQRPTGAFDKLCLPLSADGRDVSAILAGIYPAAAALAA